jgi:hypothetical protein
MKFSPIEYEMQLSYPLPRGGTDLMGPIVVLRASTQTASVPFLDYEALVRLWTLDFGL